MTSLTAFVSASFRLLLEEVTVSVVDLLATATAAAVSSCDFCIVAVSTAALVSLKSVYVDTEPNLYHGW